MDPKYGKFRTVSVLLSLLLAAAPGGAVFAGIIGHQPVPILVQPTASVTPVGVPLWREGQSLYAISPAVALTAPTAYGADWGQFFLALGGSNTRSSDVSDGSAALGMGVGNADSLALEGMLSIISLTGDDYVQGFNFKLHRRFTQDLAAAIGTENVFTSGGAGKTPSSEYVAVSGRLKTDLGGLGQLRLIGTVGVGNERFGVLKNNPVRNEGKEAFAALAWFPHEAVSLLGEYVGGQTNVGISVAPLGDYPVVVTAVAYDLSDRFEFSGSQADYGLALGYSFR